MAASRPNAGSLVAEPKVLTTALHILPSEKGDLDKMQSRLEGTAVIILQYISVSNQHVVPLKFT